MFSSPFSTSGQQPVASSSRRPASPSRSTSKGLRHSPPSVLINNSSIANMLNSFGLTATDLNIPYGFTSKDLNGAIPLATLMMRQSSSDEFTSSDIEDQELDQRKAHIKELVSQFNANPSKKNYTTADGAVTYAGSTIQKYAKDSSLLEALQEPHAPRMTNDQWAPFLTPESKQHAQKHGKITIGRVTKTYAQIQTR